MSQSIPAGTKGKASGACCRINEVFLVKVQPNQKLLFCARSNVGRTLSPRGQTPSSVVAALLIRASCRAVNTQRLSIPAQHFLWLIVYQPSSSVATRHVDFHSEPCHRPLHFIATPQISIQSAISRFDPLHLQAFDGSYRHISPLSCCTDPVLPATLAPISPCSDATRSCIISRLAILNRPRRQTSSKASLNFMDTA